MRLRPVLLALAAVTTVVLGVNPAAAAGGCTLGKIADLPVTMVGLRPTVKAKINGVEAPFLFDSGAFFSTLTPGAVSEFHLTTRDTPSNLIVRGAGGQARVGLTTAESFEFGGLTVRSDFLVSDKALAPGTAGLIGGNVTARTDLEYDLANGMIRLFHTEGCKDVALAYWAGDKPFSVIDIDPSGVADSQIRGWASVNGHRIKVMFDTGAATSMLELSAAAKAGVTPETPGVIASGAGSGVGLRSYFENWIGPFDSFEIGDEEIRNTRLRFGRMDLTGVDMLLGVDFFLSHRIFVSRSLRRLYFTYNGGPVFNLTVAPKSSPATGGAPVASAAAGPDYSNTPTDAVGFSRRGAAYLSRGEYPAAIADLTKAIVLDPASADYLTQRGVAHARNRQPALAMADFNQALKLKPDDIQALLARAAMHLGSKDLEQAKQDIAAADRVADKDPVRRLAIAGFYQRARMWRESISELDPWIKAFAKDDRLASALNERCWARAMLGVELDKALDDCNAALRIQPGNPAFLDSRALVHMRRAEFNRGIADYEGVLRLQPTNAWALYGRGWGRVKIGDKDAGEADMKAATAIAPRLPEEAKQRGMDL